MRKDRFVQLRISQELYDQSKSVDRNFSRYIRTLIRKDLEEKKDSKKVKRNINELPPEIRVTTPYTFYAELERVVDGDTVRLLADLGFYIKAEIKVRFSKVNAKPINTKIGKKAAEFVEKELTNKNLVVETRKRDKYNRYVSYIYYHEKHEKFVDIVRYGKIINEELVKKGLAKQIKR